MFARPKACGHELITGKSQAESGEKPAISRHLAGIVVLAGVGVVTCLRQSIARRQLQRRCVEALVGQQVSSVLDWTDSQSSHPEVV